jgi:hypothetical protein
MRIPETGRVVPCDDHHALAALVSELLADQDRRCRMGEAARLHAVDRFDYAQLSEQAQQIFAARSSTGSRSSS